MIIKNITDEAGKTPKIIGVGTQWLQPGEEKMIADAICLVAEFDDEGRPTGKKVVLPSLRAQERLGQISIRESGKTTAARVVTETEQTDEDAKKSEATAKRAATRAASKAAKENASE